MSEAAGATAAEAVSAEAKAPARIEGGPPREVSVTLTWPVKFGDKLYEKITVRRMNVAELAAFIEAAQKNPDVQIPLFDCPREVIDALDVDDDEKLNEVARDFLPRRLRAAAAQASEVGEGMPQSSPPSSTKGYPI
jgi:hypothetical protein